MSWADFEALLPLTIVGVAAVLVMLVISFRRNHTVAAALAVAGLFAGFAFLPRTWHLAPYAVDSLLIIDHFGLLYLGLFLLAAIAVAILAHSYLESLRLERSEIYILLLLATDGAAVLATSTHFIAFFLGLELLSVSLYVMIAYVFTRDTALEAGIKYLFLAATTSAFLLFGMALLYAEFGTMEFAGVAAGLSSSSIAAKPVVLAGLALILTGVGFKLSLVPFHMWTPDIYQGAPAPVAAYLATVGKGAVLAAFLRFALNLDLPANATMSLILTIVAAVSMFAGNLLALRQSNIKRILAYSSIAHMGYVLVALLAGGALAVQAVTIYLVTYFVTTLGAFGIVGFVSTTERESDTIDDYRGLYWTRPLTAGVFTAMFFSLAGLPLTAGFVGKFYLVLAGVGSQLWFLVILLIANSAIGLYYYLRVVAAMYAPAGDGRPESTGPRQQRQAAGLVLGILTALLVTLGLAPQFALSLMEGVEIGLTSPR